MANCLRVRFLVLLSAFAVFCHANFLSSTMDCPPESELIIVSEKPKIFVEDIINKYFKEARAEAGANPFLERGVGGVNGLILASWLLAIFVVSIGAYCGIIPYIGKAKIIFYILMFLGSSIGAVVANLICRIRSRAFNEKFNKIFSTALRNCMVELFGLSQKGFTIEAKSPVLQALVIQNFLCSNLSLESRTAAFAKRLESLRSSTAVASIIQEVLRVQASNNRREVSCVS